MACLERVCPSILLLAFGFSGEALAGFFPPGAFSDKASGTTGAAFLKEPAGARADAIGGSIVSAVSGAESLFWNPAGLVRLEPGISDAAFSYYRLLETAYSGSMAYARRSSEGRGAFAAGVVYASQDEIQGFDTLGNPNSSFKPSDFALSGGGAGTIGSIRVGAAVKLIQSKIVEAKGTSVAVDLGVQGERLTDLGGGAVDLGLSVRNIGPPIKLGSVADPLPFAFQAGGLWHVNPFVNGLLDVHVPVDQDFYLSLGAEAAYPVGETFKAALRAGYNVGRQRNIDGLTGVSAGFGVDATVFRIDYAWVPLGDLGTTHRVSLGGRF